MNAATDLLDRVRAAGGTVTPAGASLKLKAPRPLPDGLMADLRAHKSELLAYLIAGRHGLTVSELRSLAGEDWTDLEANPAMLEAFAEIVATRTMREKGKVPPSYTSTTFCRGCNATVPIFEGVAPTVEGCPWCFNRVAGRPVPRVTPNLKQENRHESKTEDERK